MTRRTLWIVVAAGVGAAFGLGVYTFGYAKGYSYLTNDPRACANCHIMSEHFHAWNRSSHRAAATCNDCHTPHTPVGKYLTKARNGFWHSFYFTSGRYPDPLRITPPNRRVTEGACRYCHSDIVDAIDLSGHSIRVTPTSATSRDESAAPRDGSKLSCVRCHTYVGHFVR